MENGVNIENKELCTLNEICKITGGNYKTVQKIMAELVENGLVEVGQVNKQNRDYTAYYVDNTVYKKIQNDLKGIRKSSKPISFQRINATVQSYENTKEASIINDITKTDVKTVDNLNILKQNAELSHKIELLEARNNELELQKLNELSKLREEQAKELATLNGEKVQLQADYYKLQADIKLIEDKQKTFESAWAEEKQRTVALEKTVRARNVQLLITGAVLLVVVVIIVCYFLFAR